MRPRRREFITGVASAAIFASALRSQSRARTRRVGVLLLYAEGDPEVGVRKTAFENGLKEQGWSPGDDVRIEYRLAAGDINRMRTFAKELVDLPSDVIVAQALHPVTAVRAQSNVVPIVFAMVADPVGVGLVNSLAHPGENITGFTNFEYSIVGKWLDLLQSAAPGMRRVGIMSNPDAAYQGGAYWMRELEAAAPLRAVQAVALSVRNFADIERALDALGPDSGLLVAVDTFTSANHRRIVEAASGHRLPGCYGLRYFAADGGLMSYGPNGAEVFRQAASYVDRILRGANPGDLPIQQPTKFELVINMSAAHALGLNLSRSLLIRADEVIE